VQNYCQQWIAIVHVITHIFFDLKLKLYVFKLNCILLVSVNWKMFLDTKFLSKMDWNCTWNPYVSSLQNLFSHCLLLRLGTVTTRCEKTPLTTSTHSQTAQGGRYKPVVAAHWISFARVSLPALLNGWRIRVPAGPNNNSQAK
jgi:hypothetical protein